MNICVVGLQWGDEGKGKVVDILAERSDMVVRFGGGSNAGHTVVIGDRRFALHLLPSGSIRPDVACVIANAVVVDPEVLLGEIDELAGRGISLDGRLFISENAHVVLDYHKREDQLREESLGEGKIGTTMDKVLMFCFQYDEQKGQYTLAAVNLMRAGGVATLLFLAGMLGWYWRRESRKAKKLDPQAV